MPSYSIVFTTYNDAAIIVPFLEELSSQTLAAECIVMADGGSGDDTVRLAEAFRDRTGCPLKVISGKRLNIAEGYNVAIKAASTEYIGITGPGNHYDKRHFEYLMENSLKTNADISYAPVRGVDTTDFSRWYNSYLLNGEAGMVGKVPSNHSALIKSSVFERIGYFCEDFFYAGEDTEFYYRALKKGVTFSVVREAKVYWETPQDIHQYLRQVDLYTIGDMQSFSNKEVIGRKRGSLIKWLIVTGIFVCGLLLHSWFFVLGAYLLIIGYYMFRYRRFGIKGSMLCMLSRFLPAFYMVKNAGYFFHSKKAKLL